MTSFWQVSHAPFWKALCGMVDVEPPEPIHRILGRDRLFAKLPDPSLPNEVESAAMRGRACGRSSLQRGKSLMQKPPMGLEPMTVRLRSACSTSWAKEALLPPTRETYAVTVCKFWRVVLPRTCAQGWCFALSNSFLLEKRMSYHLPLAYKSRLTFWPAGWRITFMVVDSNDSIYIDATCQLVVKLRTQDSENAVTNGDCLKWEEWLPHAPCHCFLRRPVASAGMLPVLPASWHGTAGIKK